VRQVPLLIVPPTINKFYAVDLAPGRSLAEFLVGQGLQVFMVSWRNPDARHAAWDLDTYGQAVLDALDAVTQITGCDQAALMGVCSGGIITAMVAAHLAHLGQQDRIAALTLLVTVLDQARAGLASAVSSEPNARMAAAASRPAVTSTAGRWPRCSPGYGRATWSGTTGSTTTCSAVSRPRSTSCPGTPTPPG